MNLKDIILSEISQVQKEKYCIVSLICGTLKRTHRSKNRMMATGTWEGLGGLGRCWSKDTKFQFFGSNKFKRHIVQLFAIVNNNTLFQKERFM
jgi:hypothetical protein